MYILEETFCYILTVTMKMLNLPYTQKKKPRRICLL